MGANAKVVVTDYVWESLEVERRTLEGLADLRAFKAKTMDEVLPELADCDAVLNTYLAPIDAAVMARMPKCRIIARYGIGVDTIDLDAATRAGIIVTNNPTYCIEEVAEHPLLTLLRRLTGGGSATSGSNPRKILFVKFAEQGSTVLAYPAILRAIEMVGRANVYFIVFEENRFILEVMRALPPENIIVVRHNSFIDLVLQALRALWRIWRLRIDAAVDLEFFSRSLSVLSA